MIRKGVSKQEGFIPRLNDYNTTIDKPPSPRGVGKPRTNQQLVSEIGTL